jgi:hypothetical protein
MSATSNAVREGTTERRAGTETTDHNMAKKTADAIQPLHTTTQRQRKEQMYQLAEIFAAIFETLSDEYQPDTATVARAA